MYLYDSPASFPRSQNLGQPVGSPALSPDNPYIMVFHFGGQPVASHWASVKSVRANGGTK
jgi:hypothetical protein